MSRAHRLKIKKTKIVATLGPATSSPEMIRKLIDAGVNTFRLNFSHGSHESHARLISQIKRIREKLQKPVAILQDLSGPKIRIGKISDPPLLLKAGDELVLDSSLESSAGKHIPLSYQQFAQDVQAGHHLLLADGTIEILIKRVEGPRVYCEVMNDGELTSNKGINYPEGSFNLPALTEKDRDDLKFGIEQGVDFVALSFVRQVDDVNMARVVCKAANRDVPIIAKIEKHEAVHNFNEIIKAVDGIMVARGDLGVEIPIERIPIIQKQLIQTANQFGKPVITATQMLLSMVNSPRPTRAEATDISNAILDGTDAIMLSEETATGNYPLEAVQTMSRIAMETEKNFPFYNTNLHEVVQKENEIPQAISSGATMLAQNLHADLILCPTSSGFTARMISRFRPEAPVMALTINPATYYRMALLWGVEPHHLPLEHYMDELIEHALDLAKKEKMLPKHGKYIITAGFPFGRGVPTNLIKAGEVG